MTCFCLCLVAVFLPWQQTESTSEISHQILDVFPASQREGESERHPTTTISSEWRPTNPVDQWDERLDESRVFLAELASTTNGLPFQVRIGQGGQIYSLRIDGQQTVPPSWRPTDQPISPWNDEVWQFVAACKQLNGLNAIQQLGPLPETTIQQIQECPFATSYFVHQSGTYATDKHDGQHLYCPRLASDFDRQRGQVRMLHWGLVPQLRTLHRSPLLIYSQLQLVGEGVLEWTWVVHHFGEDPLVVFDHLNTPWGGTRVSCLPKRWIASQDGTPVKRNTLLDQQNIVPMTRTGGWAMASQSEDPDSLALAWVFPQDQVSERSDSNTASVVDATAALKSRYRDWRQNEPAYKSTWKDWNSRPENSFRNYDVAEVIPHASIEPGQTRYFRCYLVIGTRQYVAATASEVQARAQFGELRFSPSKTELTTVRLPDSRQDSPEFWPSFQTYAKPVSGSRPLFLMEDTRTGRRLLSTDPYSLVPSQPVTILLPNQHPLRDYFRSAHGYRLDEHHCRWLGMVGYGLTSRPASNDWKRLSQILPNESFPPESKHHHDLWVRTAIPAGN